jgi:hypothetical protein
MQISQLLQQQSTQVHFPVFLVGKLKRRQNLTGLVANSANAGLIFLTKKFTNDRYLVDTGATLSIVPCTSNAGPSGPLLKRADGQQSPIWISFKKTSNYRASFSQPGFCKPQWQVPFWALIS